MFVRVCPYFPFSARVCLNQHYWLALRLQERGIRFRQCANAFLQCSDPKALQKLADSLTADDLITCAQRSEEHTSELQSQSNLVCRLLLEKKNKPSPSSSRYPSAS